MKTLLTNADQQNIQYAGELLRQGEIVAIPTETVYGIAADCTNQSAVEKIFLAKGRPQDNPLIVHIASRDMLEGVVARFPSRAQKLADAFWPGPLTLILPKGQKLCAATTAGLDSVGVRFPAHPVAQAVILAAGVPLSAPSANISGKPSPTSAEDVFSDMDGRLPLVLDGGDCNAGVESTVLSLLDDVPVLLRPGYVTKEQIEQVLGTPISVAKAICEQVQPQEKVLSPGMKYRHYAPEAELVLLRGSFAEFADYVGGKNEQNAYCLCFDGEEDKLPMPAFPYGKEGDGAAQAHSIFKLLRHLDKIGAQKVYVRCPQSQGVSLAVYNRLLRAAAFRIIELSHKN
ncbi:MAG: threonylcarbamoyl-AMP synthase [Clostridia bacterium]|nr:threonylcarbamoyl-AMP synthase [Clostridia bacterium]